MRTFKALSALISYPSPDLQAAIPEVRAVCAAEGILSGTQRAALEPLLAHLAGADLIAAQEEYVRLFDRSRSVSLNLFEHIHGDSRDRGSAMVDLLETYRAGGYDLAATELPDHLPVLLEFLSTQPPDEARAILTDAGEVIAVLAARLRMRETPYAAVLDALSALGGADTGSDFAAALLAEPIDDPDDLEALDAAWEETEVTFGPDPNAGCPVSRDMLSRMDMTPSAPIPAARQAKEAR
mgnify:CR=1 FL=1